MAIQFSSGNDTVDRMGQLDLTLGGAFNMIPISWYKALRHPSGKVNLNACVILSEICYWYRPIAKMDEFGRIKKWVKKFDPDILQKSYQELADKFGLTKRQASEAVIFLEHMGIVKRVFRDIRSKNGVTLTNVLFINLNVDRVKEITFPEESETDSAVGTPVTFECDRSDIEMGEVSHPDERGTPSQRETYTDNTTEITTENNSSSASEKIFVEEDDIREQIASNIGLTDLMQCPNIDHERLWSIYEIMCSIVCSTSKTIRINSADMPSDEVKSVFWQLRREDIEHVLAVLGKQRDEPIVSFRRYLPTLLYNAKDDAREQLRQAETKKEKNNETQVKKMGFNNFRQNDYDFDALEQKLISN